MSLHPGNLLERTSEVPSQLRVGVVGESAVMVSTFAAVARLQVCSLQASSRIIASDMA